MVRCYILEYGAEIATSLLQASIEFKHAMRKLKMSEIPKRV